MIGLRRFLLILALLFSQWLGLAHALEHGAVKEGGQPPHSCSLCLQTQDLGSALPSLAVLPPRLAPSCPPSVKPATASPALPAPLARQGAPPQA
ncbi:MAG: hypothetical protein RIR00_1320 [Pseudomonadota bacterium]|jgi:hypothetical protein